MRLELPAVIKHDELPQWIMSSETACYHPITNIIHIRKDQGLWVLIHEYLHWFAHAVGGENCIIHKIIDGGKINFK